MKLAKAMATVAGLTGLSRIFGFIRDILTAAILGAGPVGDAFFVALKLPNFFRRVTAEGAFSVAFVPLYTEMAEKDGREQADAFACNAFMVMLSILSAVVLVGLGGMPWVISAIAPGFIGDAVRFDAAVQFSRITFPYLLLMSLTALLGGVLNARGRFAPFAFAPVLFNLCLIGALLLSGYFESAGYALSFGVLLSGALQLVWLLVAARRAGVHLRFKRPVFDLKIKRVCKLMGPGVIGAGVMHINLFADMIIASFLSAGSISYLYYADRLNQLPLGVVGIAVGTALLPMLSKALAKGDMEESRDLFNRALEMCLLLALPAAAALMVIPGELITVLFERGRFDSADSAATTSVLQAYALGLPAYIAIKVFSTAHWARHDTARPVKISVVATLLNILLSLILIRFIGVTGIALATGLTGWLQFVMHIRALKDHEAARFDARFKRAVVRIVGSTVFMALVLYCLAQFLPIGIWGLVVLIAAGLGSYGLAAVLSGAVDFQNVKQYFTKT
ncbi:MAG: murein biosynthesis integral membrane protein MurJ [Rhodospirillales bacterium]|nr:murein biosynthesis integral membrane protein MurJ [Rhodospirillales bacterium]